MRPSSPLVRRTRLFPVLFTLAATALFTVTATGQTWDLKTDWSNTQNPNGVWTYRANGVVLPAQPNHEPWCWLSPQFAWARSASSGDRMPALYRQNAVMTCQPGTQLQIGDIASHTGDVPSGSGGWATVFAWTSPISGFVSVIGATWMFRDIGRSVDWAVKKNGTVLTSGTVYSGDPYSRALPFAFEAGSGGPAALQHLLLVPGDQVTFEATQSPTSPYGDIVGVNFSVCHLSGGPTASATPFGQGCVSSIGMPALQALNLPVLGSTFITRITNLVPGPAIFCFGWSNTNWLGQTLPLSLGAFGLHTSCTNYTSIDAAVLVPQHPAGFADYALAIPCDPIWAGALPNGPPSGGLDSTSFRGRNRSRRTQSARIGGPAIRNPRTRGDGDVLRTQFSPRAV